MTDLNCPAGVRGATAKFMLKLGLSSQTGPFIGVMTSDKLYDLFTQRDGIS